VEVDEGARVDDVVVLVVGLVVSEVGAFAGTLAAGFRGGYMPLSFAVNY
jgi:hypothetical protein